MLSQNNTAYTRKDGILTAVSANVIAIEFASACTSQQIDIRNSDYRCGGRGPHCGPRVRRKNTGLRPAWVAPTAWVAPPPLPNSSVGRSGERCWNLADRPSSPHVKSSSLGH